MRIGVIGSGVFAVQGHISSLQGHTRADIAAICGRTHEKADAIAKQHAIPAVYTDYRELCAQPDIEAVTIVTPNRFHADQALAAFRSGKHVLCEKPLGNTAADARRMLDAAVASGKIHHVDFPYRYLYGVRELKRRVRAGDIGEPYLLRVQYDGWRGLDPNWKIGWREQLRLSGGGELQDHGSHLFDIARYVLGPIESVTGFVHRIPRMQPDATTGLMTNVETDDLAAAWFHFQSGARGHWFASRATPRTGENGWLEVIGPEGALRASLSRGAVDHLQASRESQMSWEPLPLPAEAADGLPHCVTGMMDSFIEACMTGSSNADLDATFVDGLAAQQCIEAVALANETRVWVRLSDPPAANTPSH
ncbi:dehydrogenase [Nitrospira sp.]|nr:dehydrogenase [Nitrospira sp.]